ncbi:ACT domain-containing protein ACR8-like [Zingiber officinale]|uniref:ACT domain-containing protein ACR8-like n=1 Tax=Zingiber officinale TaxID=94328 RepID=UPI001C4B6E0A|nr:ACT domain-containing protein ACR8-like [Zingiber officinale]
MEWPTPTTTMTNMNEYEKLVIGMNNPRVVIDNVACATATIVKVDSSSSKHGALMEVVQVIADLNLSVKKAYFSYDGRWFMDVFYITDRFGRKLTDESVLSCLEQSFDTGNDESRGSHTGREKHTVVELIGNDRPGLLSEVFAVLADHNCGVVEATVWVRHGRIACCLTINDALSGGSVADAQRLRRVESRLRRVLEGDLDDARGATAVISPAAVASADRRLHQMLLADRDYERGSPAAPAAVSIQSWAERGYSVLSVQCRERPKLLFDVLCALTDMEYVVFHGAVDTAGDSARQECYIRHNDGTPIGSKEERQRVVRCLQASIERRASPGTRLELRTPDQPGILADVTRTLRENGLLVTRAEVSTKGDVVSIVFYVTGASGRPAVPEAIEAVRRWVGVDRLTVKEGEVQRWRLKSVGGVEAEGGVGIGLGYLGNFVRRNLYNLGLINSFS